MENWDDLRFLVALASSGTMKAAAEKLGTNTATVSRRIDRLSEALGEPAFVKTPDGWKPSESVLSLVQVAQNFDGQIQTALHLRDGADTQPVALKLGCIPFVVRNVLVPGMARHEDLLEGIHLHMSDRLFRDGLGDHDMVIQANRPDQGRVIVRKVGSLTSRIYYPKSAPKPTEWVGFGISQDDHPIQRLGFDHFGKPPIIRIDSVDALHNIMKQMNAAATLPDVVAANDPDLVCLDSTMQPFVGDFWLFYHESRRNDPAIRAIVEFVLRCFKNVEVVGSEVSELG